MAYANKIKFIIPATSTTVYDVPVLLNVGRTAGKGAIDITSIFEELDSSVKRKKISVVTSTDQECYIEIHKWSNPLKEALLWVKIPELSNMDENVFFLQYDGSVADSIYVGDVGSSAANEVWSDYSIVYHMNLNSEDKIVDSTVNQHHAATVNLAGYVQEGIVDEALRFESGRYAYVDNPSGLTEHSSFTITVIGPIETQDQTVSRTLHWGPEGSNLGGFILGLDAGKIRTYVNDGSTWYTLNSPSSVADGSFHSMTYSYDYATETTYMYLDGEFKHSGTVGGYNYSSANTRLQLCRALNNDDEDYKGLIEEIRIHKSKRAEEFLIVEHKAYLDELIIYDPEAEAGWLETYEAGELSPWAKRIKIDIDNTNVAEALIDFPLLINLGDNSGITNKDSTSIFDHLDNAAQNIAITSSDGVTQLPVEIERWVGSYTKAIYPPEFTSEYSNTTTTYSEADHGGRLALDPDLSLVGSFAGTGWLSSNYSTTNQKFNVAYTTAFVCINIYLENGHQQGGLTGISIKNFTIYGSNEESAFINVDYADTTSLTELGSFQATKHVAVDTADPQFFDLSDNTLAFKYYILRIADHWGGGGETYLGIRHIELQSAGVVNEAQLWTKVPLVNTTETTALYLYYDITKSDNTTYVGTMGSSPARTVWDDNFLVVLHMSNMEGTTIRESASANDFTSYGSITDVQIVDMAIGKGISFDGVDDYLNRQDLIELGKNDLYATVEYLSDTKNAIVSTERTSTDRGGTQLRAREEGRAEYKVENLTTAPWATLLQTDAYGTNSMNYYAFSSDGKDKQRTLCYNANNVKLALDLDYSSGAFTNIEVGRFHNHTYSTEYYDATVREVRISDVARSDTWLKTSYYSNIDTLVTYDDEEVYTVPTIPQYYYHGYTKADGVAKVTQLYLYNRVTGALVDSAISDSAEGYYLLETYTETEHFIVAITDEYTKISDKLLPNGV